MILTCPECATRYFIDGGMIGYSGRTVRCTSCSASWHVYPEDEPIELSAAPADEEPDPGGDALAPAVDPDASPVEPAADSLPGAFRAKAEVRRKVRKAAAQGAVWAFVAGLLAVLLGGAIIFRKDVVRFWPKSASAYAAVGLPVNTVGLTIENVQAQPGLQDGRAAVVVTGALRNIEERTITAPPLRINLLNAAGKTVQGKIAAAADPKIPPGETRHFTISLLDPPSSASDVEVVFELSDAPAAKAESHAPAAHVTPQLRPTAPPPIPLPAPVEARPLTDDALALPHGDVSAHD